MVCGVGNRVLDEYSILIRKVTPVASIMRLARLNDGAIRRRLSPMYPTRHNSPVAFPQ